MRVITLYYAKAGGGVLLSDYIRLNAESPP